MPNASIAAKRQSMKKLLKTLRKVIADERPIYALFIKGFDSEDVDAANVIIGGTVQGGHSLNSSYSPKIGHICLHGHSPEFADGLKQIAGVAEDIKSNLRVLFDG